MTDKITIAVHRDLEPGTYEYKTVIHKAKDGKILFDIGTLISESRAALTDPAVGGEKTGTDFCFIGVGFFVVLCCIGLLLAFTKGTR